MRVSPLAKHRELPQSFRRWVLVGLVALQLVTVGGILASFHYTSEQNLLGHMRSTLGGVAEQSATETLGFLEPAVRSTAFAHTALESGAIDTADASGLEGFFLAQLVANEEFDGMYFGGEDGSFVFVNRDDTKPDSAFRTKSIALDEDGLRTTTLTWRDAAQHVVTSEQDPNDAYDPRIRPWYLSADATNTITWTDPYIFFSSQKPGITVSQAVHPAEGLGGAVGVDLNLGALSGFLATVDVGSSGGAFIVDGYGALVAFPDPDQLIDGESGGDIADVSSVEDPRASGAYTAFISERTDEDAGQLSVAQYQVDGDAHQVASLPFSIDGTNSWVIGVYAADADFLSGFRATERVNISIAVVISLLVAMAGVWIARRVVAPVAEMHGHAHTDQLTGLGNRRRLETDGAAMVKAAVEEGQALAVATIDVDHFKLINDTYGHAVGDEVLVALVGRFRAALRDRDLISRHGGEEFIVVLPDTDLETAHKVIDRLRAAVDGEPIRAGFGVVPVTVSAGVAGRTAETNDLESLVSVSDAALFDAKRLGRNRVVTSPPFSSAHLAAVD